jgi:isopenicillin N synthase-like dioxygenase
MSCHHYPVLEQPPLPGQLRTGAHTDYGAMTILAATDAEGGLEVRMRDGSWAGVKPKPGEFVVNLGDMMARWTNGRWASTLHRVVNPPLGMAQSRRLSIGMFVHPNYDQRIECVPTCLAPGEKPRYETISAGEHIKRKIERSHTQKN